MHRLRILVSRSSPTARSHHAGAGKALLVAVLLPLASIAASSALAREWHFDVSVDGLPIGAHDLVLHENGDARSVKSDMKFGLIGMQAYQQHAEESWQGDCLARIDTRTEEKGNVTTVA